MAFKEAIVFFTVTCSLGLGLGSLLRNEDQAAQRSNSMPPIESTPIARQSLPAPELTLPKNIDPSRKERAQTIAQVAAVDRTEQPVEKAELWLRESDTPPGEQSQKASIAGPTRLTWTRMVAHGTDARTTSRQQFVQAPPETPNHVPVAATIAQPSTPQVTNPREAETVVVGARRVTQVRTIERLERGGRGNSVNISLPPRGAH